jgi:heat shock protein HtpX
MNKFYNNVKTVALLGLLSGLILFCGAMIGGRQGVTVALFIAAGMNFVSYFFSDKIALAATGAQEVGPDHELYRITAELAQRANLPMPRVYVSPEQSPNAFATGRNPHHAAVCATEGLLALLDRREVAGVMAHELSHVKHRDILITSIAATIAAGISYLGYMFMWGGRGRDDRDVNPLAALLIMLLGPLAAGLIQAAISRSREFNADTAGAEMCGDARDLASALQKIHAYAERIPMNVSPAFNSMFIAEPVNVLRSIGNLFQTHPPLEARLENLLGAPRESGRAYRHVA